MNKLAKLTRILFANKCLAILAAVTLAPSLAGLAAEVKNGNSIVAGQGGGESQLAKIEAQHISLAGLKVAVWRPLTPGPYPLIIFSHGFHGRNVQSDFLMQAMANDGYLVVAPNHRDAVDFRRTSPVLKPALSNKDSGEFTDGSTDTPDKGHRSRFLAPSSWSEDSYRDRCNDITSLVKALRIDTEYGASIDWSRFALAGHSLGGYTVLGLAGSWPSWKLPGVKAVLALSPYCKPLLDKGRLSKIDVPVMYQGGSRDFGITPVVRKTGGAYGQTQSPAYFVEFSDMGHFGWTNLNHDDAKRKLIDQYSLAFLDKYLQPEKALAMPAQMSGVVTFESK